MKFEDKEGSVKVSNGGDAHKFKISDESAVMVIDSLINLYSDPVGSLMRELVSNAIDANRERDLKIAGEVPLEDGDILENFSNITEKPCVEVTYLEGNKLLGVEHCISIKDWGNGLSPDRVASVFTVMGTSTKRVTDKLIGGYGIGAKSAFAYTDTFYVKATHNKVERMYMLFKGNALPEMHVVHEKPSEEKNNTEVIVPLKDSSDLYDFEEAIETQLLFFNNVVYKGFSEHHGIPDFVYETENIILPDADTSGKLKCLVGRVIYPIDYSLLATDYSKSNAGINGYLRFKIGEVDLIPSRENLRYTEKTVKAIEQKIRDAAEEAESEIKERISKEQDFFKWYLSIKALPPSKTSTYYGYNPPNNIEGKGLNALVQLAQFSAAGKDLKEILNNKWPSAPDNIVAILNDMGTNNFTIGIEVKTLESYYSKSFNETRERLAVTDLNALINHLVDGTGNLYHVDGKYSGLKTAALAQEHDSDFLVFKTNVFPQYLSDKRGRTLYNREDFQDAGEFIINYIERYYCNCYKAYADVSTKTVSAKDDLDISIQEYRKLNQTIFYKELTRDPHPNSNSWRELSFKIQSEGCKVSELEDFVNDGGVLIYGYSDQDSLLKMCGGMLMSLNSLYRESSPLMSHLPSYTTGMRDYRIIKVAKNLSSQLAPFTYINDFFMDKYKELIEFMTCHKISSNMAILANTLLADKEVDFTLIDSKVSAVYDKVADEFSAYDSNRHKITGTDRIVEQVLNMCTEHGLYNTDLIESSEALVKYVEDFPMLVSTDLDYTVSDEVKAGTLTALGEFRVFKGIELPECPYSTALEEKIPELNEE